jgi:hypothetical protein
MPTRLRNREGLEGLERLGAAALPILAVVSFAVGVGATIAVAGHTLGYDYQAYVTAADRLLHGQALYDPAVNVAGPFAVYLYPPPFAVAFVPFALLPSSAGLWLWILGCVGMTLAAIAVMPVRPATRWWVLLLAGLDWPVVYAIKLGQIAPLLLLILAIGWRSLGSERVVGAVAGVGTLVKLQPALLFGWALLTRRVTAVGAGALVVAGVVVVTLPFVGVGAWADYVQTIGRVSAPVTTPHSMTIGAVAYQSGASAAVANVLQVGAMVVTVAFWAYACLRRSPGVGFLTTVVASQLLSPLVWDHYAVLLLLPVAWLLEDRRWWAALIPLATSIPLLDITPPIVYPIVFFACLIAPTLVRRRAAV